jgi:glycosyltransferase involved in cell wall biosynthesis
VEAGGGKVATITAGLIWIMRAVETFLPGDGDGIVLVAEAVDCGGTERLLQSLVDRFPRARVVAAHFPELIAPAHMPPWAEHARLVELDRRKRHYLAPLYARRMAATPIAPARLVVCFAHHGWGHAVTVPPGARQLCYSAGLPKALYWPHLYLPGYPMPLRPVVRAAIPALRAHDQRLMRRPHRLLTNSRVSAEALERVHGRTAEVVHPCVRTSFFTPSDAPKRHVLAVSRLVPQKDLEGLVRAFHRLDDTLVVVGEGAWRERLRAIAPPNVRFTGWVPDAELRELYRSSRALVCPSVEEFGIAMAEAHACGVPVIAPRAGGALEIVDDPATGVLLDRVDVPTLAAAVGSLRERYFDPASCRASAERFGEERFIARMEQIVAEELALAEPADAPAKAPASAVAA